MHRVLVIPASPHDPMYITEITNFGDLETLVNSKYCSSISITLNTMTGINHRLWIDDATDSHKLLYNARASEIMEHTIVGTVVLYALDRRDELVSLDESYAIAKIRDHELRVSSSLRWKNI